MFVKFRPHHLMLAVMAASSQMALASDQEATELDTVRVTSAAGFEQNIADAPASISVISAEELNKKSYTSITDAIKNIPGLYMTGGGAMEDISIRGMSPSYTMYLVDGRPVSAGRSVNTNGNDGGKQIGLPPLALIERIEVIRGPMSSLYGSDAMGGIINIITKKTTSAWSGNLNTEWTRSYNDVSNDEQKVDLMAAGGLIEGLLGMQVSGSWQGTDESDLVAPTGSSSESTPEGKNKQGSVKLILTPDSNNELALGYTASTREYSHNPGKSVDASGTASSYRYDKDIYVLSHDGQYDDLLVSTYLQHDISDKVQEKTKRERMTIFNTQATAFLGGHALTGGVQYRNEEFVDESNGLLTANVTGAVRKVERWLGSVFAEMDWTVMDDLSVTTGVRYDDDELFGGHLSPRLYAVYHATQDLTLKGGVSTGYKQPTLSSATAGFGRGTGGGGSQNLAADGVTPISRALIVGNEDLDPETSTSYELGYVFDNRELGLNTSLMLFHTRYKDKIAEDRYCTSPNATSNNDLANYACQFGGNTYYFLSTQKNIDEAVIQGVEFTLDYQLLENLSISSSYTFTESEQKTGDFKGEPLNKMPKHMANASLDWAASDRLNVWTQFNYRGKTSDYLGRTSMTDGTPGYGFADAGLTYGLTPAATVKLGVYNIANKEVTNSDYGAVLDGRRLNMGLSVNF